MTLDELHQTDVWTALSRPQQKFTEAYLKHHGDKLKAAHEVWNAKSDAVALDMARRALRRPAVRKAIAVYRGVEIADAVFPMTKRELSDLIARRLRTPNGMRHGEFLKLSELFCFLRGWNPAAAISPPVKGHSDSIDDIVIAMERSARKD